MIEWWKELDFRTKNRVLNIVAMLPLIILTLYLTTIAGYLLNLIIWISILGAIALFLWGLFSFMDSL